ncbi:hypothetical protein QOZ80_6BG0483430 [Eleusine coracana subsp. coracana]|nr:hypothetical protein QOZ80_6BG0483430 [Eleusine coracana subsp. coracana]
MDNVVEDCSIKVLACCIALCFYLLLVSPFALFFILLDAGLLINYSSVSVAVDDASLRHLALVVPANGTTGGGVETVSYNLSLAVAVRNPNWGIAVWRTAPLDAELRFRGQRLGRAVLAGGGERERIGANKKKVYRVAAAAVTSEPVALDGDEVAEFIRESVAGVFELELVVAGEFTYQTHRGRSSRTVSCPLRLSLSTAAAAAAFESVECTTACTD